MKRIDTDQIYLTLKNLASMEIAFLEYSEGKKKEFKENQKKRKQFSKKKYKENKNDQNLFCTALQARRKN